MYEINKTPEFESWVVVVRELKKPISRALRRWF